MTIRNLLLALAVSGLMPLAASSQDNEDAPARITYVTYYVCDVATQGNMDSVVGAYDKPVFDQWVKDGKLVAWGYLSHFTGGRWRRAEYHVSPSMDEALDAQSKIFNEIYADNREGGQARAEACEAHDDYMWSIDQSGGQTSARGETSLSVYFECEIADEERADEIFAKAYAPQFDKFVQDGKIASWSWQSHLLGGQYRRLQTITGETYAAVNAARVAALQNVNRNNSDLGREFSRICDAHVDYLWDIVHDAP
jgi:hypothetical protein